MKNNESLDLTRKVGKLFKALTWKTCFHFQLYVQLSKKVNNIISEAL